MASNLELEPVAPDATEIQQKARLELLRRAQNTRAKVRSNFGRDVENKDPSKHYIWANVDPNRVAYWEGLGYEIVKKTNSKAKTKWQRSDGSHRNGDGILMHCDLDLYEAYQALSAAEALEQDQKNPFGLTAALRQFSKETGVKIEPVTAPATE